ncbi:uncharacterized protein LOC130636694 isoform X1 [Hydractinia symbiolongicarpus]|uniref:uncharacterized protein LOC130636694 isoform X1 n=3 Tax=Hydractinia symbiolongicarpus TaxID=13093 RepID=UPI002550A5A5|nr:uncharacterized protein LOC130636694 isoform X1 [Hydractinia symbiolongicarpus]
MSTFNSRGLIFRRPTPVHNCSCENESLNVKGGIGHTNFFFQVMAFPVNTAELTKLVECNICLHSLVAPKQLLCGHTFCKGCLDDLLKFDENGSASIECPMKCDDITSISMDKTTEFLPANFALMGVLDLLNKHTECDLNDKKKAKEPKEKPKEICHQSTGCQKPASRSCSQCSLKSCTNCWSSHSCNKGFYTSISFDGKSGKIQPLCQKHQSIASDVCIKCDNLFICIYCSNREHKDHEMNSIEEIGTLIKHSFAPQMESLKWADGILQELSLTYDNTSVDLKNYRERYVKEIKARKLYCLQEYAKMLNKMEEGLYEDFDNKIALFRAEVSSVGLLQNQGGNNLSDFYQILNRKALYELIAEQKEIEKNIRQLASLPYTLPRLKIFVGEMPASSMFQAPFGKVEISVDKINSCDLYVNQVKFCIFELHPFQKTFNLERLGSDFKSYMELSEEYCENVDYETIDYETIVNFTKNKARSAENTAIKKTKIIKDKQQRKFQYTSYDEVLSLIKQNDAEAFRVSLTRHPNLANVRDFDGSTLLIDAAYHNKPSIVEILLKHNSDVWAIDMNGDNAYHFCARLGYEDVLRILINHDHSRINQGNKFGNTPLHDAYENDSDGCVRLLLATPGVRRDILNMHHQKPSQVTVGSVVKDKLSCRLRSAITKIKRLSRKSVLKIIATKYCRRHLNQHGAIKLRSIASQHESL